ncbi:MAG: hypothetical protein ACLGHQ_05900, partial [Acidimicrobiia bacterium]
RATHSSRAWSMAAAPHGNVTTISITLTSDELGLLIDGLHALEYWDYATELDLPRGNGQVFLPEDDPSCWQRTKVGADEENAIDQIRRIRRLQHQIEQLA